MINGISLNLMIKLIIY